MARGRKPKPIELKDAEGNRGRRPLPDALAVERSRAEPPAVLGEAGGDIWRTVVEQLSSVGALATLDHAALLATCLQWDDFMTHRKVLDEQGHFTKGSMGQVVEHPALKAQARAAALLLKGLAEFAATPAGRARLATEKHKERQTDEFEEIVGELISADAEIEDLL